LSYGRLPTIEGRKFSWANKRRKLYIFA